MIKNEETKYKEYSFNDIKPIDFRSEKDYLTSVEHILQVTSDIVIDWKKREDALKRLGSIIIGNYGQSQQFIKLFNTKLYINLNIQMVDLRSSLMKEACRIVILSARELGILIEPGIEKMLTSSVLYKLAGSANKLISETSSNAIYQLIQNVQSSKIIGRICDQATSKGNVIRLSCANELLLVVVNYPQSLVMKNQQIIEDAIKTLLSDSIGDVRVAARKVYFGYSDQYTTQAKQLFNRFERHIQKAINDDESNGVNKGVITSMKESSILSSTSYSAKMEKKVKGPINPLSNSGGISYHSDIKDNSISKTTINDSNDIGNINCNENGNRKRYNNEVNLEKDIPFAPQKLDFSKTDNNRQMILKNLNNRLDELTILTGGSNTDFSKEDIEQFIKVQLDKLDSTNVISEKISVFESIGKHFNDIFNVFDEISKKITKRLIDAHIENLTENHKTLINQIIKNLSRYFYYLSQIFTEFDNDTIIKLTVTHLCTKDSITSKSCNQLIELIRKKIDSNQILKSLIELITEEDCDEEICFQAIMPAIEQSKIILQDSVFFNNFFMRLCQSNPECGTLIKLFEKLYRLYQQMFTSAFTILTFDNKKRLKYILDINNSFLLKHLIFDFSLSASKKTNATKSLSNVSTHNISSSLSSINNSNSYISNTKTAGNNDMLCKEMLGFLLEKNKKAFIDYALIKDISQIRKFIISLITFKDEDINVALIFLFEIISNINFSHILNDNLRLMVDSLIFLLINNPKQADYVKEILILMPLKLKIEPVLTLISQFMITGNDPLLIQIFLMAIKNYIVTNKERNLNDLLPYFVDSVFNMLNHQSSDIRKHAVYCAVEIYLILGYQFEPYLNELPQSQQNLIRLFIKKKTGN